MTRDVIVMVRGGKYYQSSSVTFDESDSGRSGYKVIYTNYPGERPVIIGGRRITGWTKDSGHIWKAYLADVDADRWDFNRLYENGASQRKARYPNNGYLHTERGAGAGNQFGFVYGSGDLPTFPDITGAEAYIWSGFDWVADVRPITSINTGTRTVTLDSPAVLIPIDGNDRYYVQGIKAALDQPGEFWLDRAAGYLYYYPRNTPIADQDIVAPTVENIFIVKGSSSSTPAQNIQFEGLAFHGSEFTHTFHDNDGVWNNPADAHRRGLIYFENASYNTVVNCTLAGAGYNGVMLNYYSSYNTITGNDIGDFGFYGVLLGGRDVGDLSGSTQIYDNHHNTITNNYIHDGGKTVGHGGGMFLYQSGDNTISHNVITRMTRYGIGAKGVAQIDMPARYGSVAVTWANHWDFVTTRNNLISYNDISHVIEDSEDAGFVSMIGSGKNNVIDSNTLHDVTRNFGMTQGIYLDDGVDYTTVTRNTVYGLRSGTNNLVFGKGIHNVIDNNVLVGGTNFSSGIRTFFLAGQRNDQATYTNNIFYQQTYGYWNDNWDDYRIQAADRNVFYNTGGSYLVHGITGVTTFADWQRVSPYAIDTTYGTVTVQETPSASDKSLRLVDTDNTGGNGVGVTRSFYSAPGVVSYELDVNASQRTGSVYADLLDSSGTSALTVGLSGNGTIRMWTSGVAYTDLQSYSSGTWYTIRVDADVAAQTFDVYVDGRQMARAVRFLAAVRAIDRVRVATGYGTGTYYVDDLKAEVPGEVAFEDVYDAYVTGSAPTYDQRSVTSDPLFVDPANDDYQVQSGSPALTLGFDRIDYASIGLDSSARVPTQVTARDESDGVHLSWEAISGASSYVVRRTTTSGESYSSVATPSGTTTTDRTALKGKRYYYTVSAVISSVEYPASTEVGIDTVYMGALLSNTFDAETTGAAPAGYSLSTTYGTVSVQEVPSAGQKSMRLVDSNGTGSNGVSATKTFTAQTGTLTFEMELRADQTNGTGYFELRDSSGNAAASLGLSGAGTLRYYTPSGAGYVDFGSYSARTFYTLRVVVDVAAQTYDIYVDDVLTVSDVAFYATVSSIDRFVVLTGFGTGTYYVDYATLTTPVLIDDLFDGETTSAAPAGWALSTTYGTASVQEVPSAGQKSMRLVDTDGTGGNGVSAEKTFNEQTGTVTFEVRARADQTTGTGLYELRDSSGTVAVGVGLSGAGTIRYYNTGGAGFIDVQRYTARTFYTLRVVADVAAQTYDLYIDGSSAARGLAFNSTVRAVDRFVHSTGYGTGTYYADYVLVDS